MQIRVLKEERRVRLRQTRRSEEVYTELKLFRNLEWFYPKQIIIIRRKNTSIKKEERVNICR